LVEVVEEGKGEGGKEEEEEERREVVGEGLLFRLRAAAAVVEE